MTKPTKIEVVLSRETKQLFERAIRGIEALNTDLGSTVNVYNPDSDLYHDEDTMVKVSEAISTVVTNPLAVRDTITALQNAGIKFREVRSDGDD